jgi:2-polyprenyl-3-methyl-5-hydroxy-6-metoxy-1,4-benzoquinol methylase
LTKPACTWRLEYSDILDSTHYMDDFDAVVASEILEHLEQPDKAVAAVYRMLRPGCLAYFQIPINSPAPDHIFLWQTQAEVEELLTSNGFTIVEQDAATLAGYTIERAIRRKVAISTLFIVRKPLSA